MSEEIGRFSLTHIGSTYGINSAREITSSANFQGHATGFGTVWGTLQSANPLSDCNVTSGEIQ